MKGFHTEYRVEGHKFGSYILCDLIGECTELSKRRGLGEVIVSSLSDVTPLKSHASLSDEEFMDRIPEILHQACFVAYVTRIRILDPLSDMGVIHQLAHLNAGIEAPDIDLTEIRLSLLDLEMTAVYFGVFGP